MKPTSTTGTPPRLRGGGAGAVARVQGDRRPAGPQPARHDLRAAGQVHRLQEGPRAAGALRGRGLHLLRPRGADRLDRPLRPGQGRHARAVRVDPHPRRRARRAPPPGLGAALAAPLGARHRQGARAVHRAPRPPPVARGARRLARDLGRGPAPPRGRHRGLRRHVAQHARDLRRRDHRRAHRHARRRRQPPRPRARRRRPTRPRTSSAAPSTRCPSASARSPSCSTSRTSRCARSATSSASPRAASARSTRSSSARSSSSCPRTRCSSPPSARRSARRRARVRGRRSTVDHGASRSATEPPRTQRRCAPTAGARRSRAGPSGVAAPRRGDDRRRRPAPRRREVLRRGRRRRRARGASCAPHNRELHFAKDAGAGRVDHRGPRPRRQRAPHDPAVDGARRHVRSGALGAMAGHRASAASPPASTPTSIVDQLMALERQGHDAHAAPPVQRQAHQTGLKDVETKLSTPQDRRAARCAPPRPGRRRRPSSPPTRRSVAVTRTRRRRHRRPRVQVDAARLLGPARLHVRPRARPPAR